MMKVLYSGYYNDSGYPFHELADEVVLARSIDDLTETDSALIIWGGADIDPALYKHRQSRTTYPGGKRDYVEWELMNEAARLGIPIIGVCRGAQMLCALAGGFLYQDVRGHAGSNHYVTTYDGERFRVNSIHHQMLGIPKEGDHVLLAWASERLSDRYIVQNDIQSKPPEKEPEFVYFPKIKGYAIQWHPEAMDDVSLATQFIMKEYYARATTETV